MYKSSTIEAWVVISREEGGNLIEPTHPDSVNELEFTLGRYNESEAKDIQDKMTLNYREILGETIYAYVEEIPDISYAVTELSKFIENPEYFHYVEIKWVVRHLIQEQENWTIW